MKCNKTEKWLYISLFSIAIVIMILCKTYYSESGYTISRVQIVNTIGDRLHTTKDTPLDVAAGWVPPEPQAHPKLVNVAIALGITTRKQRDLHGERLRTQIPFFRSLMASFCQTCSPGYNYSFVLAYDDNDEWFTRTAFTKNFIEQFFAFVATKCTFASTYTILLVSCNYTQKPSWAQNDAVVEAYLSGSDYVYRVNDDSQMLSANWTEAFINKLESMDPPRVGAVGPNHVGGNTEFLTYDFVHKTHIEIFGFHYPREFPDWFPGEWITRVYQPGRSAMMDTVQLLHTLERGQRYTNIPMDKNIVYRVIDQGKEVVSRYVACREKSRAVISDPRKVISLSLHNVSWDHQWGAIRNAHLAPVVFPGWSLRVYTENPQSTHKHLHVPQRVLDLLESYGVTVIFTDFSELPEGSASLLVADDLNVDVFLIRNPTGRLSERDAAAVSKWLGNSPSKVIHSVRDHPKHSNLSIIDDQWGATSMELRSLLGNRSMRDRLVSYRRNKNSSKGSGFAQTLLNDVITNNITLIHDGVTCDTSPNVVRFTEPRIDQQYAGQLFDAYETPLNQNDITDLVTNARDKC